MPIGSKERYEQAAQWREFGNIVEMKMSNDNYLYCEGGTGLNGTSIDLEVAMANEDEVCAMQCDIVLPEGCSIEKNAKGRYAILYSDRFDESHKWTVSDVGNNTVRLLCYSLENELISGDDGVLFTIPFIAETGGTYNVKIANIEVTKPDESSIELDDIEITVDVKDYIMGDVNGDGEVTVTDIVGIVSYIMEQPAQNFNAEAADLNGDGKITVSDIVSVVNIILSSEQ